MDDRNSGESKMRLAVGLTLLLMACQSATAPQERLDQARARWASRGPRAYSINVTRSCECSGPMTGPVAVLVWNDVVQSRRYVSSGDTVPTSLASAFPSVEEMFSRIERVMAEHPARLDVRYDPATGYPSVVSIDYDARMVDDEIVYRLDNLMPATEVY